MRPFGAGVHLRAGTVNLRLVRWMVIGSVPAAFLGAYLLHVLGNSKSAQTHIETVLGIALLIGAGAMALRFVLDRRGGQNRLGVVHDIKSRPLPTVAIGIIGGVIVGMTSVGSGSLMIVLLLFVYPTIGANQLVGTDLTQAVPLTLAAALGALLFGHVVLDVTAIADSRQRSGRARGVDAVLDDPRPLRPARDRVRDLRLRPQVRRASDHRARLDAVRAAVRRRRDVAVLRAAVADAARGPRRGSPRRRSALAAVERQPGWGRACRRSRELTFRSAGGTLATFRLGDAPGGAGQVLAVHGITANSRAWLAVARELEGRATLLAPDLRGRGASNGLPAPYGMKAYSRDMLAVLDHFELERAVLVGHSLGAYAVARFAADHPERVRAVLLVDGGLTAAGTGRRRSRRRSSPPSSAPRWPG